MKAASSTGPAGWRAAWPPASSSAFELARDFLNGSGPGRRRRERRVVLKPVPLNPCAPAAGHHAPDREKAFDDIYSQNFSFVWRCLRGLGLPPAALDDAAQDVFLVVHRQLVG